MFGLSIDGLTSVATVLSAMVALASMLISTFIARSNIKQSRLNTTMEVVMHCASRYAKLVKLRNNIPENEPQKKSRIESYFRQYWGLKSDQIDYWIAGYIDSDTIASWVLSTANDLSMVKNGLDYAESWESVKEEHHSVNPTMNDMVNELAEKISKIDDMTERFEHVYAMLWHFERTKTGILKINRQGNLRFSNLLREYSKESQRRIVSILRIREEKRGRA